MAQCVTATALERIARRAIAASNGSVFVEAALLDHRGTPWIVGVGKAVGAMAEGARRALGMRFRSGPLIGKHVGPDGIDVIVAAHPLPDVRGVKAARALLEFVHGRRGEEEIVLLLSGGASALLAAPVGGVSLAGLRAATDGLVRAGARIDEVNCVRRHLGLALGGRLAIATRARVVVLALSDVVGDDPAAIGSGPASPDPSTVADALGVMRAFDLAGEVRDLLEHGAIHETPKPGDPRFSRVDYRLLATPVTLRERAAAEARAEGIEVRVETPLVTGEVEAVAARYLAIADTLAPGEILVAVGEPTVPMRGGPDSMGISNKMSRARFPGRGGRAQHLALLVARAIAERPLAFLAIGSDGTDGPTDDAGALVDGATVSHARSLGFDVDLALAGMNSSSLLGAAGALLRTGPTGTNLCDLHLLAALDPAVCRR